MNSKKGLILAVVLALAAVAADWPRFRGPNGTGVSDDKNIPIRWAEGDGVLWKVKLPGAGNGSPVVQGGRVFLQAASDDGKDRMMLCLDAASGRTLWARPVPGGKAKINRKNSLASSTPALDGDRVFGLFWDGDTVSLHAFDVRGKPLWHRDLGGHASQHGFAASPMVHDGKVIVADDQDGTAALVAFDASTGKPMWRAERRAFRACYSTPFVRESAGQPAELIVASTAGVTGYDPKTGKENWDWKWDFPKMALRTVASPVYADGLIFVTSGDGSGARHVVAVAAGGKQKQPVWETERALPYVPCLLTFGEHVYYVNDRGIAGCVAAKTGEQVWSERLGGDVSASPVLIDGKIYSVSEDGQVYVFQAGPKFEMLAKNKVGEPVLATPAVAGGRLYIRGKEHLICIGKAEK